MSLGTNPRIRTASTEEAKEIQKLSLKINNLLREEAPDASLTLNSLFTVASNLIIQLSDVNYDEQAVEAFRQNLKTMRLLSQTSSH